MSRQLSAGSIHLPTGYSSGPTDRLPPADHLRLRHTGSGGGNTPTQRIHNGASALATLPMPCLPAPPSPATPVAGPPDTLDRLRAGALVGATRLDLRGCGLTRLPPDVLGLADTLQVLDLSGNALVDLPDGLASLRRLQVLFASDNLFTTLPAVLGRCPALQLIGFKANRIHTVPAESLPPTLRWLILTDNQIDVLPESLGRCAPLQKLMLAGNRLHHLPDSLARCQRLELVRLAANRFPTAADALSHSLLALPQLAWLAHAGNPFSAALEQQAEAASAAAPIAWSTLQVHGLLGEGASGVIHAATWHAGGGSDHAVAVKLFKGAVTSDGLPGSEMAACMAAGSHPHLVGVLGRLAGHPGGTPGLVLQRIPPAHANLAGPPSLASCSRDVYASGLCLGADAARAIAQGMQTALAHLHRQGLAHGDLYAHNILADAQGHALLGDLGAASFLPVDDTVRRDALQRIDRRALAVLLDELAALCTDAATARALRADARLQAA